jgi:DNA-binding XRE family transcriptional regulator
MENPLKSDMENLLERAGMSKKELREKFEVSPQTMTAWNKVMPVHVKLFLKMKVKLDECQKDNESFRRVLGVGAMSDEKKG